MKMMSFFPLLAECSLCRPPVGVAFNVNSQMEKKKHANEPSCALRTEFESVVCRAEDRPVRGRNVITVHLGLALLITGG